MRLHHRSAVVGLLVAGLLLPGSAQAAVYPGPQGPRDVHGAIEQEWLRIGGARSVVGAPLTNETRTPSLEGAYNHFERGSIYWSPRTGAHEVHGSIRQAWAASGWENGVLGYPTTDETRTPNGRGVYNHFARNHDDGSIYWSPATGAHMVRGVIRIAWGALGYENGFLGFPTRDQTTAPDGQGSYTYFEGGSIYWSPGTGAHEVHGQIWQAWAASGWETGPLGYPVTDETRTPNGRGTYNNFRGGSIYWSPTTGAQVVTGEIRDAWAAHGWEGGALGFPIGPRQAGATPGASYQQFQNGIVYSSPSTGVHVVQDQIAQVWLSLGGDRSSFGPPRSDEYTWDDRVGRRSDFTVGSLEWSPTDGVHTGRYWAAERQMSGTVPVAKLNEPMLADVGNSTEGFRLDALAAGGTDRQTLVVDSGPAAYHWTVPIDFGDRRSSHQRTQLSVGPLEYGAGVRLLPLSAAPSFGIGQRAADEQTAVWHHVGPAGTAHFVASAPGTTITVTAYDGRTDPLGVLASGVGAVDTTAPLAGDSYVYVQCDGPWSITVE